MAKGTIRPGDDVRRRPLIGLALFGAVVFVGTAWYSLVEHFSAVNAFYQTVTTILTVGFGEVEPLGSRGRIFTVVLLMCGVGVALYVAVTAVESFVENKLGLLGRRRVEKQIANLSGHTVVCGYGRIGRDIVRQLADRTTLVVVDSAHEVLLEAQRDRIFCVGGDATDDETLRAAGVANARTLIVSLRSDADAISTVLSAREINPLLRIVARANADSTESKLHRAGADHVVNPLRMGAVQLATFSMSPSVADFVDLVGPAVNDDPDAFRLEEFYIPVQSDVADRRLGDLDLRGSTGALLLALRCPLGRFRSNPGPDEVLQGGSTVIAIGTEEQLRLLGDLVQVGAGS